MENQTSQWSLIQYFTVVDDITYLWTIVAFIKEDQWGTRLLYYEFLWWPFILWTLWWPSKVSAFRAIILPSFSFWMSGASFSKKSFNHNHFYCHWSWIILKKNSSNRGRGIKLHKICFCSQIDFQENRMRGKFWTLGIFVSCLHSGYLLHQ